jgi:hypothetical protein
MSIPLSACPTKLRAQGALRVSNGGHAADGLAGCGATCRLFFDAQGAFLTTCGRGWRWEQVLKQQVVSKCEVPEIVTVNDSPISG